MPIDGAACVAPCGLDTATGLTIGWPQVSQKRPSSGFECPHRVQKAMPFPLLEFVAATATKHVGICDGGKANGAGQRRGDLF